MANENEILEPLSLDVDLSAVETQKPTLPKGLYNATIMSAGVAPNKEGTGRNLIVKFGTDHPYISTTGKQVNPGFTLTRWFHLQNKEGAQDPEQWKQGITELWEAATGSKDGKFDSTQLIGAKVILNVAVEDNQGQPSNKVQRVTRP